MTIAKTEPMGSELVIHNQQSTFSPAQRAALGHMGVDKAPDADVQVFFHVCQRTRLDPFAKQIYMIGRKQSELIDGKWEKVDKFTIQTGIDGFRVVARRVADESGDELSYGDTMWCGPDGVWRDVWTGAPEELHAAKATVLRAGKPFTHVALFREYVQTTRLKTGEVVPNSMWASKGANQLAKCAEAGALRKAYPQDLGGLYVDAEVDHLANEAAAGQTVSGVRDWYSDAAAATTVQQLADVWSAAHRAHQLDEQLMAHIRALRAEVEARMAQPEPAPERIDEATGEVLDAEVVTDAPPASSVTMVKRATASSIVRELVRCGVVAESVDAYLPALGIPRALAELTQDEAVDLLEMCRTLTRDKLADLMASAAGSDRG